MKKILKKKYGFIIGLVATLQRQFETKTAEMNTTEQLVNDAIKLLRKRFEARKSLGEFEEWLKKEVDRLKAPFQSELSALNELIEEAEQAIKDHKIASIKDEDDDLKKSLETNRALFSWAPAALASLREEKDKLEKKIAEVIDKDSAVLNLRQIIANLKIRHGFTD